MKEKNPKINDEWLLTPFPDKAAGVLRLTLNVLKKKGDLPLK